MFPNLVIDTDSFVVDLGANAGYVSLYFARQGAKVLAFEPNPWSARHAIERLQSFPSVSVVTAAVGRKSGVTRLFFPTEYAKAPELHSGSASVLSGNSAIDTNSGIQVFQVSLLEILRSAAKVDFLKIDVEGSEGELWPAIEDYWEKIRYLAVECHPHLLAKDRTRWFARAETFIATNQLQERWRLDWP